MKHLLSVLVAAVAVWMPSMAEVKVSKTLYQGDAQDVTWENTLKFDADEFTTNVFVDDYIHISFSEVTIPAEGEAVVEIKSNGTWLPGSIKTVLTQDTKEFRAFITKDMLTALKSTGLEICGNFKVTEVSICNDGTKLPDNAIWGGYFWVDSWNTMDLFKTAFDNYDGQRYMDIYLSDEVGDNTGYIFNVLTSFEPRTSWAENDAITKQNVVVDGQTLHIATVDLENVDVKASLADKNALLIQGDKGTANPFNMTAIVLRAADQEVNAVSVIEVADTVADIYTVEGILVKSNADVEEAKATLPAGMYIAAGRKFIVK